MRHIVLAAALVGCVQSTAVSCPDQSRCPTDFTCVAFSGDYRCIPDDDVRACEGKSALESCVSGRCYASDELLVCQPTGCGNAFVDPEDEECDDGNNVSGDGCSADCQSNETCGNDVVDPVNGEQCDDGDILSHGGCSSSCNPERPAWTTRTPQLADGCMNHGMAFDVKRGRLVVFGGLPAGRSVGEPTNDTWEWDGAGWIRGRSPIVPAPRESPAMAYDGAQGTVVMFGGDGLADTWEWNGSEWTPSDAVGPSGRTSAAMVYDSAHRRIVLFGGYSFMFGDFKHFSDTWEWRDGAWTERVTPTKPAVEKPAMAYDPERDRIVLVGKNSTGTYETWELDATDWRLRGEGPILAEAEVAFDPRTRKILLVGPELGNTASLTTWQWDGQAWTPIAGPQVSWRNGMRMATDPLHGQVLLFGGRLRLFLISAEIWQHGDTGWTVNAASQALASTGAKSPGGDVFSLQGAAVSVDPRRGHALLVGGLPGTVAETWSFDGVTWRLRSSIGPGPRHDHGLAFDVARDRAVLFGGVDRSSGAVLSDETWLWDGATETWARHMGAVAPPARRDPMMAYDARRSRVVLFGGSTSTSAPDAVAGTPSLGDTWEWDGSAWTRSFGPSPPPRAGAAFGYDPVRERVVLFGGQDESGIRSDTWTYDGTWREEQPPSAPAGRAWAAMAWDAGRARLVLVGGVRKIEIVTGPVQDVSSTFDDVWEWDGLVWRAVAVPVPITRRFDHVMFTSPRGIGIDLIGGRSEDYDQDLPQPTISVVHAPETFELRWFAGGTVETCVTRLDADGDGAAGCADGDCWPLCRPLCPPGSPGCAALSPRCGDGTCTVLESASICPTDCGSPPVVCGDLVCDPAEICLGDCPP